MVFLRGASFLLHISIWSTVVFSINTENLFMILDFVFLVVICDRSIKFNFNSPHKNDYGLTSIYPYVPVQ